MIAGFFIPHQSHPITGFGFFSLYTLGLWPFNIVSPDSLSLWPCKPSKTNLGQF